MASRGPADGGSIGERQKKVGVEDVITKLVQEIDMKSAELQQVQHSCNLKLQEMHNFLMRMKWEYEQRIVHLENEVAQKDMEISHLGKLYGENLERRNARILELHYKLKAHKKDVALLQRQLLLQLGASTLSTKTSKLAQSTKKETVMRHELLPQQPSSSSLPIGGIHSCE